MYNETNENKLKIYATYNDLTIRVYQAYSNAIADEAIALGRFGKHFKIDRMTWIKPSFLWMMYRSGWAEKENQERILAIDIKRSGFNTILESAVVTPYNSVLYDSHEVWSKKLQESDVRCQWDPDRTITGARLDRRAIQLGLRGSAVKKYISDWIVNITDITQDVLSLKSQLDLGKALLRLPVETEYPVEKSTKLILGMQSSVL